MAETKPKRFSIPVISLNLSILSICDYRFQPINMRRYEPQLFDPLETPERNLMRAVLERAIVDLFVSEFGQHSTKDRESAVEWFMSDDLTPYSFLHFVEQLALGPVTIKRLRELAQMDPYDSRAIVRRNEVGYQRTSRSS